MTTTKWRISTPETALIALTGSRIAESFLLFFFQAMTNLAVNVDFMFD